MKSEYDAFIDARYCNGEDVTVTLTGVHDNDGRILESAAGTMKLRIGDVNGDEVADKTDVKEIRRHAGRDIFGGDNFRDDVNCDGSSTRPMRSSCALSPRTRLKPDRSDSGAESSRALHRGL